MVQRLRYYDFRVSVIIILLLLLAAATIGIYIWMHEFGLLQALLFLLIILLLAVFSAVTVSLDEDTLYVSYGVGVFGNEIDLALVESCGIPENRFIRTFVYSPFCRYALEVRLRGGGRLLIPAAEPKRLADLMRAKY